MMSNWPKLASLAQKLDTLALKVFCCVQYFQGSFILEYIYFHNSWVLISCFGRQKSPRTSL